jgi:hypothetical protein
LLESRFTCPKLRASGLKISVKTVIILIYNTIFTERDTYTSKLKHNRTIIHIDIDCFYAQVEMIRNPQLREKPLGKKQQTKFSKNIIYHLVDLN